MVIVKKTEFSKAHFIFLGSIATSINNIKARVVKSGLDD